MHAQETGALRSGDGAHQGKRIYPKQASGGILTLVEGRSQRLISMTIIAW